MSLSEKQSFLSSPPAYDPNYPPPPNIPTASAYTPQGAPEGARVTEHGVIISPVMRPQQTVDGNGVYIDYRLRRMERARTAGYACALALCFSILAVFGVFFVKRKGAYLLGMLLGMFIQGCVGAYIAIEVMGISASSFSS